MITLIRLIINNHIRTYILFKLQFLKQAKTSFFFFFCIIESLLTKFHFSILLKSIKEEQFYLWIVQRTFAPSSPLILSLEIPPLGKWKRLADVISNRIGNAFRWCSLKLQEFVSFRMAVESFQGGVASLNDV